jgi:BirA family biotin operon repressor/biotin-[acetyl-CoA-carboxylase] ligase
MYDLAELERVFSGSVHGSVYAGKLHFSPVTGSTNADAIAAARNGAPHGSVFFADEQTAGRGRGDHSWESAAGQGLYVSVLLRPSMDSSHLPVIPLAAGLAAANAIVVASNLKVDLRWPNDILIGDRKAGGILVESKADGRDVSYVVIGIGINVHQRAFEAGLSTPATSLDIESGRHVDRQTLLVSLLESLQQEVWGLHDPTVVAAIPARVALASTWLWNRRVVVHGPQACAGITAGLDANGFLLVRTDHGTVTVQTGGIRAADTE